MSAAPAGAPAEAAPRRTRPVSMRWKLLAGFAGVFTLVFAFIAVWVFRYTSDNARTRLVSELASSATGGASNIHAAEFTALVTTVPAVPDASKPHGFGYPDSPLYRSIAGQLLDIRRVVADAGVYSYFRDPADGKLYFAASAGYLLDPQIGVTYKVPVADAVPPATYALMEQGLERTTDEPEYSDDFGNWISAYAPIKDARGGSVGAIGIDYPMTYVDQVESGVRRQLFPVLGVSYAVLLLLVLWLSTLLTRPLKRLDAAAGRIADGDYDVDLDDVARSRFPDEMYTLTRSFQSMADRVAARERSLTQEVKRLTVEIDHARREQAVKEITETDFFSELTAKAAEMRRRVRDEDPPA